MSIKEVNKVVAKYFGIKVSDIKGLCRNREFVDARQVAWKILKDNGYGVCELGRAYNKNHGAVGKGIKRITGLIEVHRKIEAMYKQIKEELCY